MTTKGGRDDDHSETGRPADLVASGRRRGPMTTRRIWISGPDPGVLVVDVDPPLGAEEVEIDLSDPEPARASQLDEIVLAALLGG